MIKKISQLNELPLSVYDERCFDSSEEEELLRKKNEMLFEVSYETADKTTDWSADQLPYYTSYNINLSGLGNALDIPEIWENLSALSDWLSSELSASSIAYLSGNLIIGKPGDTPTSDRVSGHTYRPGEYHLCVFSDLNLENNLTAHGPTEFHNNVKIKCNDANVSNKNDPCLVVDGVATFKQIINGVAYRAQWGDLAEYYLADENYEPGTLVKFGGDKEVTIAKDVVNGVVTTNPGIVLNGKDKNETSIGVALVGRVPVRIRGPVKKFDKIVLSHTDPGIGVVYNYAYPIDVIARALEDNQNPDEKLVMCVTRFSL